jgi:hypothetical protein
VVGDPKDSRRFYFGAVNGGVWRTDDAGRTWQPLFEDVDIGSIGAIAVAPSAPNIIYVGTGEADMRSDIAQGIGMFRRRWRQELERDRLVRHAADRPNLGRPAQPHGVLVAALGHPYGPNAQRGVFRTTEGGRHWTKTLYKDANTGAIDLAFEPGNRRAAAPAATRDRRGPPDSRHAGGFRCSVPPCPPDRAVARQGAQPPQGNFGV